MKFSRVILDGGHGADARQVVSVTTAAKQESFAELGLLCGTSETMKTV
jgi:hypothetical protein